MVKKDKLLDKIQSLFSKHKISAILTLADGRTYSIIGSKRDKLMLLHHARIELSKLDIEIEKTAASEINETVPTGIKPKYV